MVQYDKYTYFSVHPAYRQVLIKYIISVIIVHLILI